MSGTSMNDTKPGDVLDALEEIHLPVEPGRVFQTLTRIGGRTGWYAFDWLWRLRGAVDRMLGGPGMRRGRRHPEALALGDAIDFWRVVALEPERRLVLEADTKLPGRATLEWTVAREPGGTRLRQLSRFEPDGLLGRAYWYGVLPLHKVVFGGMLRGIAQTATDDGAPSRDARNPSP